MRAAISSFFFNSYNLHFTFFALSLALFLFFLLFSLLCFWMLLAAHVCGLMLWHWNIIKLLSISSGPSMMQQQTVSDSNCQFFMASDGFSMAHQFCAQMRLAVRDTIGDGSWASKGSWCFRGRSGCMAIRNWVLSESASCCPLSLYSPLTALLCCIWWRPFCLF